MKKIIFIVIVLIFVIWAGFYFFSNKEEYNGEVIDISEMGQTDSADELEQVIIPDGIGETIVNQGDESGSQAGVINCGVTNQLTNSCFVSAAKNGCQKAKLVTRFPFDMFGQGVVVTQTNYSEMLGLQGGKCLVYQRIDDINATFSDELIQRYKDWGMTDEEIREGKQEWEIENKGIIGRDGSCKYPLRDWIQKVEEMFAGEISGSISDVAEYGCTGSLYQSDDIIRY